MSATQQKGPMLPIGFMAAPDLHDRIMAATKAHGISISELCRDAVESFLTEIDTRVAP